MKAVVSVCILIRRPGMPKGQSSGLKRTRIISFFSLFKKNGNEAQPSPNEEQKGEENKLPSGRKRSAPEPESQTAISEEANHISEIVKKKKKRKMLSRRK